MIARLPPTKPSGPFSECLADHGEPVDPGLELRGNREIGHRCADHDDVGGKKIRERLLPQGEVVLQNGRLPRAPLNRSKVRAGEMDGRLRTM